jgi:hypothetical protein
MLRQIVIGSLAFLIVSVMFVVSAEAQRRGRSSWREVRVSERHRDARLPRIIIDSRLPVRLGRPPGWDWGRKVGWGNCDVPPGLAKKVGCRQAFVFGRQPRRTPNAVVIIRIP